MIDFDPTILWPSVAVAIALAIGSSIRLLTLRRVDDAERRGPLGRLKVWWGLLAIVSVAIYLGTSGIVLFFLGCSLLAIREFLGLVTKKDPTQPTLLGMVCTLVTLHFVALGWLKESGGEILWLAAFPILLLFAHCGRHIIRDRIENYLDSTLASYWGAMTFGFGLSFAFLSYDCVIAPENRVWGPLVLLVLLTECNDILQSLVGKQIGKTALLPHISPHKTWEGLLGGAIGTCALTFLLTPFLTDLASRGSMISAVAATLSLAAIIVATGLAGDLNMSLVKRSVKVKDSGNTLPGMGGIVDRVDSLSFTAPAFFFWIQAVAFGA